MKATNGTATVSQTTGTKFTSEQTVSRKLPSYPIPSLSPTHHPSEESSIAIGETVDVKVGIPEIADVTSSTSLSTTFTNTLSKSTSSESNQQTTQTVAIAVAKDKSCKVNFEVKTCTTQGSGQIPFVAEGWVWFEYEDKTEDHYKCTSIDPELDMHSVWTKRVSQGLSRSRTSSPRRKIARPT